MNDDLPINEYDLLLEIFRVIRNYSTSTYTLPNVFKELIQYMKDGGYRIEVIDEKHRDYKILQVEAQRYKIIRWKEWSSYDVVMTM